MLTYAHRGFGFKENSIQSFLNAFKYFDGIEFDVRLTKDNIPVVIHDYNLLRTHKIDIIIHLHTYEQLSKYHLPTLDQVLKLVSENHKKCLIDIKASSNSQFIIDYLKKLVDDKKYSSKMFKCIVYTDNLVFYPNIKVLRAYRLLIPEVINPNFEGISVQFKDNNYSVNTINKFLGNYSQHHLNIYLQHLKTSSGKKYLADIEKKYKSRISLTSDHKIEV